MIKSAQSTEKQQSLVKLLEQDKTTLEHEIGGYRREAQKQRKVIQQLEKERDRYINDTSSLMQKAGFAEEQTRLRLIKTNAIIDLCSKSDFATLRRCNRR